MRSRLELYRLLLNRVKTADSVIPLGRIAAVLVFLSIAWMAVLTLDYRKGSNLAHVMVRCLSRLPSTGIDVQLVSVSPWGTETTMVRDRRGHWMIPLNDKRAVNGIRVNGADSSDIPESGWEISISPSYAPDWRPIDFRMHGLSGELILSSKPTHRSILRTYAKTWNWLGDGTLVFMALAKVLGGSAVAWFGCKLLWQFCRFWQSLSSKDVPEVAPQLWWGLLTKCDRSLLWMLVIGSTLFAMNGLSWTMLTLWPGINDDGALFTTVILNRSAGLGNRFSGYTQVLLLNDGKTDFATHGQLYNKIVASLLLNPNYASLLWMLHFLNLTVFLLCVFSVAVHMRRWHSFAWLNAFIVSIPLAFATVAVMHHIQGRPEHGIPAVMLSVILSRACLKSFIPDGLLQGLQIGLVAAMSPLPGVLLAFASVFNLGLQNEGWRPYLRGTLLRAIVAALAWFISTWISYEGTIVELVQNTVRQGGGIYSAWNPSDWSSFWMNLPLAPRLGVVFVPSLVIGSWSLARFGFGRQPLFSKLLMLLSAIPICSYIWSNGIAWAGFNYTFLGFLPALVVWMFDRILTANEPSDAHSSFFSSARWRVVATAFLVVSAGGVGMGAVRTFLLQPAIWNTGVRFSEARQRIAELTMTLDGDEVIMVDGYDNSRSAMVLDVIPGRFRTRPMISQGAISAAERKLGFFAKYYLVLQRGATPPEREDFHLIEDHFTPLPIFAFGREISWYTPGYGFALYERE
jgi:hypothetical protein